MLFEDTRPNAVNFIKVNETHTSREFGPGLFCGLIL